MIAPGRVGAIARGATPMMAALALIGAAPVAAAQQAGDPAGEAGDPAATPVAAAIRAAARGPVELFYRDRGYWPIWSPHGRPGAAATALIDLLGTLAADGLDPVAYAPERLAAQVAAARGGDPAVVATAEIALSQTLARLVADMRAPHAETAAAMAYADASLAPAAPDAASVLRRAALAPSLARYVRDVQWMHPLYTGLRRAALDARLVRAGPRVDLDRADAAVFGRGAAAVRRADVLRLDLDRARLLPDAFTPHIVVDAAAARLSYYDAGAEVGAMRVVVGTPATPTPMLAGMVRYATLNPYWNVPVDLVRRRIAPALVRGASLPAMGYEALSDWTDAATPLDPATIDWRAVADGRREVRVRELPGGANSMGAVKFTFPNDEGIYLHDTDNRALFEKADRHFSNGCVRLEDAARLGRWLNGGAPLAAASAAPEQHVALARPVPVYITYLTRRATDDGIVEVPDVYARDMPGGARDGRPSPAA